MTTTANPQASTTIECRNGRRIVITPTATGHSVTVSGTKVYDTVFTADRIPADQTTAEAAAQYASQLANENGGVVPAEGTILHTWDLDRLTIAVTYVGGVYDSYVITCCYLGTVNTVGDLRWAVQGVDRAVAVCLTLVAKLRSTSPQRAIDVCPNLSDLHDLAA